MLKSLKTFMKNNNLLVEKQMEPTISLFNKVYTGKNIKDQPLDKLSAELFSFLKSDTCSIVRDHNLL